MTRRDALASRAAARKLLLVIAHDVAVPVDAEKGVDNLTLNAVDNLREQIQALADWRAHNKEEA